MLSSNMLVYEIAQYLDCKLLILQQFHSRH